MPDKENEQDILSNTGPTSVNNISTGKTHDNELQPEEDLTPNDSDGVHGNNILTEKTSTMNQMENSLGSDKDVAVTNGAIVHDNNVPVDKTPKNEDDDNKLSEDSGDGAQDDNSVTTENTPPNVFFKPAMSTFLDPDTGSILSLLPIATITRFYIYALHGFLVEIVWTALWELVVNQDIRMPGNSHMWAFGIYGLSCLMVERLCLRLVEAGIPLVVRALVYTVWVYWWEFTTGFVLRLFAACPWDYEPWFTYHIMGLVTLEYAPAWFLCNILMELVLMPACNSLYWGPDTRYLQQMYLVKEKQGEQSEGEGAQLEENNYVKEKQS